MPDKTTAPDHLCACGKEPIDCPYSVGDGCPKKASNDVRRIFAQAERQRRKRLQAQKVSRD